MPWELTRPVGLALLGLLVPLVVLYVLRVQRKRRVVPSTWLWQAALRDLAAQSPFRRLTPSVPLLLETLALVALALALSGPVTRSGSLRGSRAVLIVDVSASMGTLEGKRTRLELAVEQAKSVLKRFDPGTEVMVVAAGREPELTSPFERDPARLEAALGRLAVREVEGQLGRALALASDQLRQRGGGRIVVISDGAVADGENLVAPALPVDFVSVGTAQENTAIVRLDVAKTEDPVTRRARVEVFALVTHQGQRARDVFVTLGQRNVVEPLASRKLTLQPGERAPVVLSFDAAPGDAGQGLEIDVSPHDAMPADDRSAVRVPADRALPVVVAPRSASPWLLRALATDPGLELFRTDVSGLTPAAVSRDALVIVEGACPERLPGTDVLIINPPEGSCRGVRVGAVQTAPLVTSWSVADARLRFLSLDGLMIEKARTLTLDSPRGALLRSRDSVLMADVSSPGRMGTLIGFDVGESNWPLRASFVLFVRNVLELGRAHRIGAPTAPARTGEAITIRVPLDVETVEVEHPGGRREQVRAREGVAVLPPPTRVGFIFASWKGAEPGDALIPTGLSSELESRNAPRKLELGGATAKNLPATSGHRAFDWLFGALALALVLADVFWVTRRNSARALTPGRTSLIRRPLLLALLVAGAVPALIVAAGWARLFDVPFVRFQQPALTAVGALGVAVVALRLLDLSERFARVRRGLVEASAGAAALLASLCMAGLEIGRPLDKMTVVVAADRSRSIDLVPGAATRIQSELRVAELGMRDDDRIAVVAFGSAALVEDPARPRSQLPSAQRADVPRDGTDIAAGLRQALAEIPPDSSARLVLISDGVSTRGDTTEATLAATALGVPIDVVALDQGKIDDVRVVSVHAPTRAAEGEALDLRIVTESSAEADVVARVYRNGELLRSGTTHIARGEDVIYLREVAPGPGLHRYDVELSAQNPAQDRAPDDNAGSTFVRVRGPSTALVLESEAELARAMASALSSSAFRVDSGGPSAVPGDLAGFARYDLVVLGDISAPDLSTSQLEAIRSYVRDLGGGVLLMGGDRALGPGGYARTPVEEISPVSFDLKQERRRASLAEVIAVDYSGSMAMSAGGKTKLELANEAAARSAELLGEGDRLGVMHVDTAVSWTVPLGPVIAKADIASRILKVGPGGGGILIDLTLQAAYAALRRENVQLKHLLLFSDGNDAEERTNAFALVSQAKRSGITTSVVALGNGSDVPALARMAELGGGRFYLVEDATRLPAVFAQETILASRSAINEQNFVPRPTAPNPILRGIDFGSAPPLTGYVVTIPKARSQVLLQGPENDPILATWSAGVGRAGVFASDYKDRWGRAWTGWDGAARLFAQLGRDLARRIDDPRTRWEAEAIGGELLLRATVFDERGRRETMRRLHARVGGPDGFTRNVPLEAIGAGSFAAKLPLSRPGSYLATLIDDEQGTALATTGAALSAGEELRPSGTDRGELRRIASLSGGMVRDTLAGIFNDRNARRFAYRSATDWLSTLAACLLLASVASRRLSLPRWQRKPRAPVPAASSNASASATLDALRAVKERRHDAATHHAAPTSADPQSPLPNPNPLPDPLPHRPPLPDSATTTDTGPSAARPKSAAEILLERRKQRGPR